MSGGLPHFSAHGMGSQELLAALISGLRANHCCIQTCRASRASDLRFAAMVEGERVGCVASIQDGSAGSTDANASAGGARRPCLSLAFLQEYGARQTCMRLCFSIAVAAGLASEDSIPRLLRQGRRMCTDATAVPVYVEMLQSMDAAVGARELARCACSSTAPCNPCPAPAAYLPFLSSIVDAFKHYIAVAQRTSKPNYDGQQPGTSHDIAINLAQFLGSLAQLFDGSYAANEGQTQAALLTDPRVLDALMWGCRSATMDPVGAQVYMNTLAQFLKSRLTLPVSFRGQAQAFIEMALITQEACLSDI